MAEEERFELSNGYPSTVFKTVAFSDGEWLLYTGTGYLLRLDAWTHPVLQLRQLGLSKACRRLVTTLMKRHGLTYLHIDALGDVLPGFATFDW